MTWPTNVCYICNADLAAGVPVYVVDIEVGTSPKVRAIVHARCLEAQGTRVPPKAEMS